MRAPRPLNICHILKKRYCIIITFENKFSIMKSGVIFQKQKKLLAPQVVISMSPKVLAC